MNKKNVTRKELAVSVTKKLGFSHRKAAEIVDTVFETLKNTLVNGKSIKLVQFGRLNVRDKCPRWGRNPKTGESMVNFEAADDHFPSEQTVVRDVERSRIAKRKTPTLLPKGQRVSDQKDKGSLNCFFPSCG